MFLRCRRKRRLACRGRSGFCSHSRLVLKDSEPHLGSTLPGLLDPAVQRPYAFASGQDSPMSFPHLLPTYARADVAFVRGEGAYLFDEEGRRYLDFGAGVAVNALGHAHPHLVEALREQAGKLWHTSNLYRVPGQETLARRLIQATFADTVFFTNSGVEAIE